MAGLEESGSRGMGRPADIAIGRTLIRGHCTPWPPPPSTIHSLRARAETFHFSESDAGANSSKRGDGERKRRALCYLYDGYRQQRTAAWPAESEPIERAESASPCLQSRSRRRALAGRRRKIRRCGRL